MTDPRGKTGQTRRPTCLICHFWQAELRFLARCFKLAPLPNTQKMGRGRGELARGHFSFFFFIFLRHEMKNGERVKFYV
jgi:hypothetical protein